MAAPLFLSLFLETYTMPMDRELFEEKRARRLDRLEERAEKQEAEANARFRAADAISDCIPLGQPILVGHHSEKRHRRDLARIDTNMGKGIEAQKKAQRLRERIAAAESNDAIMSDDPDALEKLRKRIAQLEALQEAMKGANRVIRSKSLDQGQKIDGVKSLGFDEKRATALVVGDRFGDIGFPRYKLTNNNANIRRLKQRLAAIENCPKEMTETTVGQTRILQNPAMNRVQLFFPCKPSEQVRSLIKQWGFRWARSENAWQRHLNNSGINAARYVADRIAEMDNPFPQ